MDNLANMYAPVAPPQEDAKGEPLPPNAVLLKKHPTDGRKKIMAITSNPKKQAEFSDLLGRCDMSALRHTLRDFA